MFAKRFIILYSNPVTRLEVCQTYIIIIIIIITIRDVKFVFFLKFELRL